MLAKRAFLVCHASRKNTDAFSFDEKGPMSLIEGGNKLSVFIGDFCDLENGIVWNMHLDVFYNAKFFKSSFYVFFINKHRNVSNDERAAFLVLKDGLWVVIKEHGNIFVFCNAKFS